MYSVMSTLFLLAALMIIVGFFGRVGTEGLSEIDANVASAFGLIFVYGLIFASFSSFSELVPFFESICGGIPFLDNIADYGSLQNVIRADPISAAVSFLDVVILSTTINVLSLLPLTQGNAVGKLMVKLFTGIVLALVSLLLLNYVIKGSAVYQWVVSLIAGAISIVSVGSIPLLIVSLIKKHSATGVGIIGAAVLFSQSKVAGILRDSFLKAVIYVLGIWLLEKKFGSIAAGMSQISMILVAFGPVVVMLIGIVLIIKSAFSK